MREAARGEREIIRATVCTTVSSYYICYTALTTETIGRQLLYVME